MSWILACLLLAVLAGALGSTAVAAAALTIAKVLATALVVSGALVLASRMLRRQDRGALAP